MSTLQELVEQSLEPETEEAVQELLRRKVAGAVSMYIETVRAVEQRWGPEAKEALRRRLEERTVRANRARGRADSDNSLRAFCTALEAGCRGSHEWEKVADDDTRQAYRFTRCLWAEVFRELDAADIGVWICRNDGPTAAAYNPAIRFERTKTLMEGDDCCDHIYFTGGTEER